jgi:hypothetical protein
MSPVSHPRPRRWIAVILLLVGTLGIAETAQGTACLRATPMGQVNAAPRQDGGATETAEPRARSTATAGDLETPHTPHDTGPLPAAGNCGATAIAPMLGTAPAEPPLRLSPAAQPEAVPTPGPDPAPSFRPPRQS